MSLSAWVIVFLILERSVDSLSEKSSLCILECLGGFKHSCSQQSCRAVCRGNESDELLCPRKYMKSLLVNGKSIIYCEPDCKPKFHGDRIPIYTGVSGFDNFFRTVSVRKIKTFVT